MDQDKIKSKLAQIFDLPQEVVLNLPVINLTGNLNMIIENHKGITKYTPDLIKIKVTQGFIVVVGKQFEIDYLSATKIAIIGQIDQLEFDFN